MLIEYWICWRETWSHWLNWHWMKEIHSDSSNWLTIERPISSTSSTLIEKIKFLWTSDQRSIEKKSGERATRSNESIDWFAFIFNLAWHISVVKSEREWISCEIWSTDKIKSYFPFLFIRCKRFLFILLNRFPIKSLFSDQLDPFITLQKRMTFFD